MILDVYSFKNKALGSFTTPTFSQEKRENVAPSLKRSIYFGGKEAQAKYSKLALYCLGTFDDEAGKFDLFKDPEFILDCDDIIAQIPEVK